MNRADERAAAQVEAMRRDLAGAISSDDILNDELRVDLDTVSLRKIPKRRSRAFVRFLVAIFIGVAGTLGWQSYGEAIKQIIATRAPALGWSAESKQMIATSIQWLGWTKLPANPENRETVAPKTVTTPSLDPAQVQQICRISQRCGKPSRNSRPVKPRWRVTSPNWSPPSWKYL